MKKWNYYNDSDPFVCEWARNLISAKLVPDGEVDCRSIGDVSADDLKGFIQCHFFCGILGWPYALRLAGWSDDRPVWTGSCPCQPFSVAGKRKGTDDERHLWPEFRRLITECNPATVFGEQVASRDGRGWLAAVRADLEGLGYAVGATDLCAAGIGAPHIRQRLFWVADASGTTRQRNAGGIYPTQDGECGARLPNGDYAFRHCDGGAIGRLANAAKPGSLSSALGSLRGGEEGAGARNAELERSRSTCGLVNTIEPGLEGHAGDGGDGHEPGWLGTDAAGPVATASGNGGLAHRDGYGCDQARGRGPSIGDDGAIGNRAAGRMADADGEGCGGRGIRGPGESAGARAGAACERPAGLCQDQRPGPLHGLWRDADWLYCRDGKWRPVEPGTAALAHGVSGRVGLLRGYGNAIVAPLAAAFITAAEAARADADSGR